MTLHTRRTFLKTTAAAATLAVVPSRAMTCLAGEADNPAAKKAFQVAAYYFPNYHLGDARNEKAKGKGWNEWQLVKDAKPRFPGHRQPNKPLWGYTNEANPKDMAQKIDAAADHGIDAFIFDWYYYEDGLFLERGLEKGFFGAANNRRLKFALMWADHPWLEIHPWKLDTPQKTLYPGPVSPRVFDRMTDYIISTYFKHPSYWLLEGRPYFSIYDLTTLLECFGSAPATRAALDRFRKKTAAAGFPGLHLNAVVWGQPILPKEKTPANAAELVKQLGFDSVTSYVWVHHVALPKFPATPYEHVQEKYFEYWLQAEKTFGVPYYPNVTMGWDPSPRANQSDPYVNRGYPFMATISGNTPERFKAALEATKERLAARPANERVLTINCWNEWTEGSYLEPDTVNGMKYLEAVRDVFSK
ncbi:MAG: glycoside hydrolase family 99-like domain-containing protein [Planctomycetaceae bacterium]|nr:glycoside hydrolase family 99-like domain-containing protein [Planctomycetaceae bacterium]